ncbi:PREDICTED: uncharacterized protein LOC109353820 [Lupinus angustifolius]|uniref:uncharacterized protein LOC109353820 n=1 Tax=Lupinus angustifolius TaxID=3871 RepID=UPI00092E6D19|nr:PREDICTED: uncharacterized protein LOC109353820 [Lupinus angustifolius]
MNQRKDALEILSDVGMLGCKSSTTPMTSDSHLFQDSSAPFPDPSSYRRLIRILIYLTNTRLDLCFFVQQLAQFMAKPTITHHSTTLKVLRYIKGILAIGLFFSSASTVQLKAYSDSDWAVCPDT